MTVPSNLVPTRITDLPVAPAPTPNATMVCVIGGVTYQVAFSDLQSTISVPASRTINTGGGLTGGGDLSQDRTISILNDGIAPEKLQSTGVVAGVYGATNTIPVITVNAKGQITTVGTAGIDFTGYVPDSRQIIAGTGLTGGGTLEANRTLSIDFSTATPQPVGVATAGTGVKAAREDHVHPAVDLSDVTEISGFLPRSNGGTGQNISALVAGSVLFTDGTNLILQTGAGTVGQVLRSNGSGTPFWDTIPGTGTVTSVGLSMPSIFSVTGSPVTITGTLTADLVNQNANTVFAGPVNGSPTAPTFRALVNADIPGTLTGKTIDASLNTLSNIANSSLTNSSVTIGSTSVSLGGTVTSLAGLTSVTLTGDPSTALQAATKQYVDNVAEGLDVKASCIAATTVDILLSGPQTIDGVSVVAGDRVLVKNQSNTAENGIYVAAGSTWSRSSDANTWDELRGAFTFVEQGTLYADTGWVCTVDSGGILGTSPVTWSQFAGLGAYVAGTGLTLTGTTFSITNTGVVANTYGSASAVPVFAVNAQGQLTSVTNTTIAITNSQVSGSAASGANSDITSMTGLTGGISSPDFIQFDTTATNTDATGKLFYNDADMFQTLQFQMNGNVVQHVGEEMFYRVRLSANATKGQVLMFTGTLGSSGGLLAAPATGLTPDQANYILGVAGESGSTNDWITVYEFGEVKNINTTGGAENWQQGDVLYYNPAVTGGLTKFKPSTPNAIAVVAAVVNVGSSNGIIFVRPTFGSVLGGTDGNVQFGSLTNGDVIVYDGTDLRWENRAQSTLSVGTATTATNLAGGTAGAVPYQVGAGSTGFSAAGNSGEFLVSGGTGSPTWTNTISGGTF
jgi:hypothetical protein